jgi:Trypsin-co-occurring domain 2
MLEQEDGPIMKQLAGLGLAEAIEALRAELLLARSQGDMASIRFPISSVSVELQVVATGKGEGKVGFKVPIIDLELGGVGSYSRETTNKVVIEFGVPVDSDGKPVRVDRASDVPRN